MSSTTRTTRDAELDADLRPATFAEPAGLGDRGTQPGTETDENIVELKTKVGALVKSKFGGDYQKAFAHYDKDQSGVDSGELEKMLKDAKIGNGFTRGIWAGKIIEKMDGNGDGKISWQEFEAGIKGQ